MSEAPSAFEEVTREKVAKVEERLDALEKRLNGNLEKMWKILDSIKMEMYQRPTWLMTGTMSLSIGLILGLVGFILGTLK